MSRSGTFERSYISSDFPPILRNTVCCAVDCDADIRLARRAGRDIAERGRDLVGVIDQYTRFVKPCYDVYVEPSKR